MGGINYGRVVLGGLVTGLIANILHGLFWFAVQGQAVWIAQAKMFDMYKPGVMFPRPTFMAGYGVMLLFWGIVTIWFYAAMRPRFGPGPRTAVIAAIAVWLLLAMSDAVWVQLIRGSRRAIGESVLAYLVIMIVATLVGAYLYREEDAGSSARSAGA